MSDQPYHIPALLPESMDALNINPSGIYVDVTYGGGGHSRAIVERLAPEGHLYGMDQDLDAISNAMVDPRFTMVRGNFRFLKNFLRFYGVDTVDGILADLGVSFHHFDDPGRGFSFRWDGPLDMRMNRDSSTTAASIINDAPEERLADIFYLYGELRQARRIASAIVKARMSGRIDTVEQLLGVVRPLINPRQEKKELAQVFQALRIEVNGEISSLESLLKQALAVLRPGGRLAIITYHSLEDRMVKNFMRTGTFSGEQQQDFYGRNLAPMRLLKNKPIVATESEVERNPRSRSAKLRIAEKIEQ